MGLVTPLVLLMMVLLLVDDIISLQYARDFKEGSVGAGDTMVCDCEFDRIGKRGYSWSINITFAKSFVAGLIITCIDVANTKDSDRAIIAKTSGGVNFGTVRFNIRTQQNHGAKFQFKMWGKVPKGKNQTKNDGTC